MDLYETQVEEMTENLTIRLKQAWGAYKKPDACSFCSDFFFKSICYSISLGSTRFASTS